MPTQAPKPKSTYEPAPQGTHMARCYQFIQIGTIQEEYLGKPRMFNKIRLSFELPMETKVFKEGESPKPISVHKEYTLSMGEKANLRKLIEGMIGVTFKDEEAFSFDVEKIVGMPCLLSIKHRTSAAGNVRDDISAASPLMKGQTCPPQFNQSKICTFSTWNQEVFDSQPDFIKEKIMESEEWNSKFAPSTLSSEDKEAIVALRNNENQANQARHDIVPGEITPDDITFD